MVDINASSGHADDILEAVSQCSLGDRVKLPSGQQDFVDEPWTGYRVTFPAGIDLIGDVDTILRIPIDVPGDPYGTWSGKVSSIPYMFKILGISDVNKPSRFSNFKMVGYRSIDPSNHMMVRGVYIENVINYRMDHLYFENMCGGAIQQLGMFCCGVTDHCTGLNFPIKVESNIAKCDVGYAFFPTRVQQAPFESLWEPDIMKVVGKYTLYSHFAEDCIFGGWRHTTASNNGGHYVFRHNIIDGTYGHGGGLIDAHGTYNVAGTRAMEVYENNFINMAGVGFHLVYWRGGGGVFFNNAIDKSMYVVLVAEGTVETCWPHEAYIWNNSPLSISHTSAQQKGSDGLMHPAPNLDFFTTPMPNYAPYPWPHPLASDVNTHNLLVRSSPVSNIPFTIRRV